jgi:hypothetical protein
MVIKMYLLVSVLLPRRGRYSYDSCAVAAKNDGDIRKANHAAFFPKKSTMLNMENTVSISVLLL